MAGRDAKKLSQTKHSYRPVCNGINICVKKKMTLYSFRYDYATADDFHSNPYRILQTQNKRHQKWHQDSEDYSVKESENGIFFTRSS